MLGGTSSAVSLPAAALLDFHDVIQGRGGQVLEDAVG